MSRHYHYDDLGIVSVKMFEAAGDGIINDTEAFYKAILSARAKNSHIIYIPPGSYFLTRDFSEENVSFIGTGVVFTNTVVNFSSLEAISKSSSVFSVNSSGIITFSTEV